MQMTRRALGAGVAFALAALAMPATVAVHVWESQELTFTSAGSAANPYTDVTVYVDLTGPDFKKRIYGFWDGGLNFRVRLPARSPGTWTGQSGSNPPDLVPLADLVSPNRTHNIRSYEEGRRQATPNQKESSKR